MNKYHVAPKEERTWQGVVYASKAEMVRAMELEALRQAGIVTKVVPQPRYQLGPDTVYVADFEVTYESGWVEAEDVKGFETREFKRKKKLWSKYGKCVLVIMKRECSRWKTERVAPMVCNE